MSATNESGRECVLSHIYNYNFPSADKVSKLYYRYLFYLIRTSSSWFRRQKGAEKMKSECPNIIHTALVWYTLGSTPGVTMMTPLCMSIVNTSWQPHMPIPSISHDNPHCVWHQPQMTIMTPLCQDVMTQATESFQIANLVVLWISVSAPFPHFPPLARWTVPYL